MSAKPIFLLLFLTTLGTGCGGDEEGEEAEGAAKTAKGKGGSKGGSKGGGKKSDGDGGMTYQLEERSLGPTEELLPLEDEPIVTDPGSVNAGACATFIDCVCNLETALNAASPKQPTLGDCDRVKAKFEGSSIRDGECAERLTAQKVWVASQDQFIADGIEIPESCR